MGWTLNRLIFGRNLLVLSDFVHNQLEEVLVHFVVDARSCARLLFAFALVQSLHFGGRGAQFSVWESPVQFVEQLELARETLSVICGLMNSI